MGRLEHMRRQIYAIPTYPDSDVLSRDVHNGEDRCHLPLNAPDMELTFVVAPAIYTIWYRRSV